MANKNVGGYIEAADASKSSLADRSIVIDRNCDRSIRVFVRPLTVQPVLTLSSPANS
jgi:hypothetical protein